MTTTTNSWQNTFAGVNQNDVLARFANIATGASMAQRINNVTSDPAVAFLLPQHDGTIHILHHLHHDSGTALSPGSGEVWGLCGADSHASPMVIPEPSLAKFTTGTNFKAPTWEAFQACTNVDEVEALTEDSKGPSESSSTPTGSLRPHCWLTSIPAFLSKALLDARSADPLQLCVAATKAIVVHASAAATQGVTPGAPSTVTPTVAAMGNDLLYILQLLWLTQKSSTAASPISVPDTVKCNQALQAPAASWCVAVHQTYLGAPLSQGAPSTTAHGPVPTGMVGQFQTLNSNLATLASQHAAATAAAGGATPATATATATKTGFAAFPVYTQRMILHASARLENDDVRQEPLDSLKEIFTFPNAAFVQRHVHNLLRHNAHHDVLIPTGLCTAIRVGAFTSEMSERPGLFSLFSCFRQPSDSPAAHQADMIRMQLKMQDSSSGLDNKDIDKLVKTYHVTPLNFDELLIMLTNFRGVVLFAFGANSIIATALKACITFFSRGDLAAQFRSMAASDPSLPACVGWFIECRIQAHLLSCGANTDPTTISPLTFDNLLAALEERRDYGLRLCNFLRNLLPTTSRPESDDRLLLRVSGGGGGTPHQVAVNSHRFLTNKQSDHWPTFLDHLDTCPITDMCCKYHMNGKCTDGNNCRRASSHHPVSDTAQQKKVSAWVDECREKMPVGPPRRRPWEADGAPPSKKTKFSKTTGSYSPLLPSCRLSAGDRLFAKPSALHLDLPLVDCRQPSNTFSPTPGSPRSITGTSLPVPPPIRADVLGSPPAVSTNPHHADGSSRASCAAESCPVTLADGGSSTTGAAETCPVTSVPTTFPPATTPLPPTSPFLPSIPALVLSDMLASILTAAPPVCHPPLFQFEWTDVAADHNLEILRQHDYDLGAAIAAHPFCAVSIGSEFRDASVLSPLLDSHPLWPSFAERITTGSDYPLQSLSLTDQKTDLAAMLERGNHKSAKLNADILQPMLHDEVVRGWQLPLPLRAAHLIPGAVAAPLGLVHQFSIDEHAQRIDKYRLTHDQSFNVIPGSNRSVNDRLIVTDLNPCRFGRAFTRLIHYLAHLRHRNPDTIILLSKVDCKSAYRRVHLAATTAVQAMVTIAGILLLALRQTFGGAANPSQWSDISEVATDLANDLVRRLDWDPDTLSSPHTGLLAQAHDADDDLDTSLPITPAAALGVPLPDSDDPKFDCYIDDIFGAFLAQDRARGQAVIPLVLALLGRPVSDDETLPRDDLLSIKKFVAEALPSERKTILGWLINARNFTVALPPDKFSTWTADLQKTIKRKGATRQHLETLLGRLNHAAYVVPHGRHFTGRLYAALAIAQKKGFVNFTPAQMADLRLWLAFLKTASDGINIDLLTFRFPSRIIRVDACPQGIGGYCLQSGVAWRFPIPKELLGCATLNTLEFLASYVGLEMERLHGPPMSQYEVLLSMGDSTSATGWMRHSSFSDTDPIQLSVARATATFFHEHKLGHFSQWFPGKENQVADSLSRDFHLEFQDLSSPNRSHLHRWELAAIDQQKGAVTGATHTKRASHWRAWIEFLAIVEHAHDPFLQDLAPQYQIKLLSCFASAIRENGTRIATYVNSPSPGVQSSTVRASLDSVASAFRANQLPSPIHDNHGRLFYVLDRQLKGMTNLDPSTKPQKALSPTVLRHVVKQTDTPLALAVGQMVVGAFFFAMRSCEYSTVRGDRRTKLLEVRNIRFYRNRKELSQHDPDLHLADCIAITFTFQKNDQRDETVTMHRTADPVLCPVRAWAAIISRLQAHSSVIDSTPVNTYFVDDKPYLVTSVNVLHALRAAVTFLGKDTLGYTAAEIGTHSLRSAAAMAMYLAGVPVYTIMLIGRWSSDAFLRYIRRQVQEFSSGVSSRMILTTDYFTIPDFASAEDPRAPGNPMNFAGRGNQIGAPTQAGAARTALSLFH